MKKDYSVEKMSDCRWLYKFKDKTKEGETLTVEVSIVTNPKVRNSLTELWHKNKYTSKILDNFWFITVFTENESGSYRKYNPIIKEKDNKINFDWILEATEENLNSILNEIIRLAYQ